MDFECGVCTVRPWRVGDERELVCHANDRNVWLNLRDRFPHPYTAEDAAARVDLVSAPSLPTHFAIVVGQAVGGVGLKLQGDIERLGAEIGYGLGAAH